MVSSNSKVPSGLLGIKYKKTKMKAKFILASFIAIATVLAMLSTVSAAALVGNYNIQVDGMVARDANGVQSQKIAVEAGETLTVKVVFVATQFDKNVEMEVELGDSKETVFIGNVEPGQRYTEKVDIRVPFDEDLRDKLSHDLDLEITIDGKDHKSELDIVTLRVQRESYSIAVMSIGTLQTVEAGQMLPVDVVLKNVGYENVRDAFVKVSIPALGAERTGYFGDIVALECDDKKDAVYNYGVDVERKCNEDDSDTVSGRVYIQIPEEAKSGAYTIEVSVYGDRVSKTATKSVSVSNAFSGNNVIATVTGKTVAAGQEAEYSVLIVNPTSKLKVYRIVPESGSDLSVSVDEAVVAVPAGSSKTVTVRTSADAEGTYNFAVNVLSGEDLVSKVALSTKVEGKQSIAAGNPVVILTIVLAVIFLVLLVVLIVLLGKKPEKSEEFGESYY